MRHLRTMSYRQLVMHDWSYSAVWDEESTYSYFGISAIL